MSYEAMQLRKIADALEYHERVKRMFGSRKPIRIVVEPKYSLYSEDKDLDIAKQMIEGIVLEDETWNIIAKDALERAAYAVKTARDGLLAARNKDRK